MTSRHAEMPGRLLGAPFPALLLPRVRARTRCALAAGVAAIACLAYLPSLGNGFVWDDQSLIVASPVLGQPGAAWKSFGMSFWKYVETVDVSNFYRPLVTLSYVLDRRLHGLRPLGYHVTNLLLHAGTAALLCLLLLELGVVAWQASLGAAFFAAHPSLAESVAWISGRTDPMAALLLLLCLLADRRRARAGWRCVSLLACAGALLAKELAAVAPALAVLIDVHAGKSPRRALGERLDLLAVLAGYLVLRRVVVGAFTLHEPILLGGIAWPTRLAGMPHLLGILLFPGRTRLEYGVGLPASLLLPGAVAGIGLCVALGLALHRSRRRAAPQPLPLLVALGFVALLPALAVVVLLSDLADRLVYLPAAFLLPACVVALAGWVPARVAAAIAGAAIVASGVGAAQRSRQWRSERTLFERAVAAPYASTPAHFNLGIAYHREGRLEEAVQELEFCLQRARTPGAAYILGLVYTEIGCDDVAIRYYRESLAADPGYYPAANNLSSLLAERGARDEALRVITAALPHVRLQKAALRSKLQRLRAAGARGVEERAMGAECGGAEQARALLRDARHLGQRGSDRLQKRLLDQAQVLLLAALRLDPGLVPARLDMARYHMLRDEDAAARRLVEGVLQEEPQDESARQLLHDLDARTPGRGPGTSPAGGAPPGAPAAGARADSAARKP